MATQDPGSTTIKPLTPDVVEGYPHIPGERRLSSSFLYNGTKAVYERAGFDFIRPKGLKNTVMRRSVAASG